MPNVLERPGPDASRRKETRTRLGVLLKRNYHGNVKKNIIFADD